jgi:hypothetical protein
MRNGIVVVVGVVTTTEYSSLLLFLILWTIIVGSVVVDVVVVVQGFTYPSSRLPSRMMTPGGCSPKTTSTVVRPEDLV